MTSAQSRPAVRVVYIVGFPRSGSTLLERLLSVEAGLFPAGEVRRIWERGFLGNELCSCGQPFQSCPFWISVVDEAFGGPDGVDVGAMAAAIGALDTARTRRRAIARRLLPFPRSAADPLDGVLLALYRAIVKVSGAPAVVDSLKDSAYAFLLSTIEGFDVEVLHLVRDSRAVAHSWQRKRRRPEIVDREEFMPLVRPTGSAVGWNARNVSAESLRLFSQKYTRLRYEDLTADPVSELERVLGWSNRHSRESPTGGTDNSGLYHTVSGNPSRLTPGPLKVSTDLEWISSMSSRDRKSVTALTCPLLLRYGYKLEPDLPDGLPAQR